MRQTKIADLLYIQLNKAHLWQVASAGYQVQGRGAVMVDFQQSDEVQKAAHFVAGDEWENAGITEILRTYNPADTFVVLFGSKSPATGKFTIRAYEFTMSRGPQMAA